MWLAAYSEALSISEGTLEDSMISDIDFRFYPPDHGTISWDIILDGKVISLSRLSDAYTDTFLRIRSWMERALTYSCKGSLNPECCTIDCHKASITLSSIQAAWLFPGSAGPQPVSMLVIIDSHINGHTIQCFCRTYQTIGRLYRALNVMLDRYRKEFNDGASWCPAHAAFTYGSARTAEIIREEVYSPTVELKTGEYA